MITKDRQGNAVTGATLEAAELYDDAVAAFQIYSGDPVALADAAIDKAPAFTMAHILKSWLFAVSTELEATAAASEIVMHAKSLGHDEREAFHIAALDNLLRGEWSRAAVTLDFLSMQYPRDILALQVGQLLDFFRGDARNLRNRIARAMPHWTPDIPGYSLVLGMHSFGLEEAGDYLKAEETGRRALAMNPRDCWAHHAVAHVMEMQGRPEDGIGWMTTREAYWSAEDNFFQVHNWWHKALFHLDLDQSAEAIAIYDAHIVAGASTVAVDLVDAAAMLWRLKMTGVDVSDRCISIADRWSLHADGRLYGFNDWHAAMVYLGAGREKEVEELLSTCRQQSAGGSESAGWAATIALPLIEGFQAWHRGDFSQAVERLHPVRRFAHAFGGSHAQRDIIDWTLTDAAIRSGSRDVAEAFAAERLAIKSNGHIYRTLMHRASQLRRSSLEAAA